MRASEKRSADDEEDVPLVLLASSGWKRDSSREGSKSVAAADLAHSGEEVRLEARRTESKMDGVDEADCRPPRVLFERAETALGQSSELRPSSQRRDMVWKVRS